MHSNRNATNPFYVLLVGVGILFVVTACAYGVMTVRMIEPVGGDAEVGGPHDLMGFMDRHGFAALMVELAVLAVLTVAAIGTDSWWTRNDGGETTPSPSNPSPSKTLPLEPTTDKPGGSVPRDRHADSAATNASEPGETSP
jgi:hypothetical protein